MSGTSYAAPVVSGLAALIRARFPALTLAAAAGAVRARRRGRCSPCCRPDRS
ncbi:hypothetical protein MAHJHV47_45010 [Mycobacterium avium subsp. hominissuis]